MANPLCLPLRTDSLDHCGRAIKMERPRAKILPSQRPLVDLLAARI